MGIGSRWARAREPLWQKGFGHGDHRSVQRLSQQLPARVQLDDGYDWIRCLRAARHPSTTAGDWLQGPYVYALYRHYGFDRGAIGQLFIAGFGSSMIFGTIVGAMADK